jgi:hypothetical protein
MFFFVRKGIQSVEVAFNRIHITDKTSRISDEHANKLLNITRMGNSTNNPNIRTFTLGYNDCALS